MNSLQAKKIRIIDYLHSININPAKQRLTDYWYLSPIHNETEPSFKVCDKNNVWYDHGTGQGGNIIDLTMIIHDCTISEALKRLDKEFFSFQQQNISHDIEYATNEIVIGRLQLLQNKALLQYIAERGISLQLAVQYCQEAYYSIDTKKYFSIAYPNDVGGYELRNKYMKNCIGKKDITTYDMGKEVCKVFEGFMDFLAYWTLQNSECNVSCIVLNSLSNISKARPILQTFAQVHLYLDNDTAGISSAQELSKNIPNCINQAHHYSEYKDINDLLLKRKKSV